MVSARCCMIGWRQPPHLERRSMVRRLPTRVNVRYLEPGRLATGPLHCPFWPAPLPPLVGGDGRERDARPFQDC